MRYFSRIFTIALPAVLILLFSMGAPTWVQAGSTMHITTTQVATDEVPAQGSPVPEDFVQAETPEYTNTPRAPRPTPTPIAIPPPSNPGTIQMLVFFGILVVLVVILGLLLNRNRVF
jgi:hypothetical protein